MLPKCPDWRDGFGKQLDLISGHVSARVGLAKFALLRQEKTSSSSLSSGTSLCIPSALHIPVVPADSTGKLLLAVQIHGFVLGILLEVGEFISLMTRGKFKCGLPEVLKQYRQSLMGQTPSSINLTIPIYPV